MEQSSESEFGDLRQEATWIWDLLAEWWDDQTGKENNYFHRTLVIPSVERLLDLRANELVLEIGCGNGDMARRMAVAGARVDAFDASPKFLERAKAWTTENVDRISTASWTPLTPSNSLRSESAGTMARSVRW